MRSHRGLGARIGLIAGLIVVGGGGGPLAAAGQTEDLERQILESQQRLEEIRAERERLQSEMESVRTRVLNVSQEIENIERQLDASRSALGELDFQAEATTARIQETQRDLITTKERLRESSAILNRRLRDIYKLGPLHTVRVLLGARSFSDLLNRYRYLHLVASHDRGLVDQVTKLDVALTSQNEELEGSLSQLGSLRQAKAGEVARLRAVESERARALESLGDQEREAVSRLEQLQLDESRLTGLVEDLERRRMEAERRRVVAGVDPEDATLSLDDAGALEWPVDGELVYRFGRETRPNGTVLRWNGIGIGATPGTPVRAVQNGTVMMAGPYEGYGPSVVLSHGGGFYTLYLYLEEVGVVVNREVLSGQVVGTVGGRDTPEGPHIEFQIRAPVAGGTPQARNPLQWLRPRPSGQR